VTVSYRTEIIALVTLCTVLFLSCLFVYTQHNSFPYYSHHDEQFKVKQLLTRKFNFNHPQLLLLSTDLVRRIRGQEDGYQRITMSGRWVSAFFAATSIVLLTLLGWRAFGLLGAWCVGLMVAVCPIVGLTAHFLKEDSALLLGFSASLLALHVWLEKPDRNRLIWLGLACGLAMSAKYIGVLCLLMAIPVVLIKSNKERDISWRWQLSPLLITAAMIFVVINWPLFTQLGSFVGGITKGAALVLHGRRPVDLPNLVVIHKIATLSLPLLLMALVGVLCLLTVFRRRCFAGWALFCAFILFTGMLLLTPLDVPGRYLLIPAVSLYGLAGLSITMIAELVVGKQNPRNQNGTRLVAASVAAVLFWFAIPVYRSMAIDAFDQADARKNLIMWVNATLNEDAVLAVPRNIRLPGVNGLEPANSAIQLERNPITLMNFTEITPNSLEAMRQNGITHIIISEKKWMQYRAIMHFGVKDTDQEQEISVKGPDVLWQMPERFRMKNRWLRAELVVLQL